MSGIHNKKHERTVSIKAKLSALLLSCAMLLPSMLLPTQVHAKTVEERPSGLEMVADVLLARPILAIGTGIGAGVYVVTLPFSLLGGNAKEAGNTLVVVPFKATFLRCLGCTDKHTQGFDR